jgi:ATP-dependent exoDNAse (exonuclease V) alpha subunit
MMDGQSAFLTGPPGAGKTYVLNEFIRLTKRHGKNIAVTASTGIAATHIGGTTIHSWSGLGILDVLSDYDLARLAGKSVLIKRYNATDILVIDEISMLHGQRLDMVNALAKRIRQNPAPFGGMQVVLVGDLFQLPPISRGAQTVDFAHLSDAWAELDPIICYLTEQHRVSVGDTLLDLLGAMRRGDVNELHEAALQERLQVRPPSDMVVTRLYSHNTDVDSINQKQLDAIASEQKMYAMFATGAQSKKEQLMKSVLAPAELVLKRGAEVMFVANNFAAGYVNGTRGTVLDFDASTPIVVLANGREVKVEPHSWKLEEDGRVRAEVSQLPLRLAWAITIHKSQGMSLDAAEIDLSRSFSPGMGYVALSRVRSIDGIYLRGVNQMALAMHPLIFEYDRELRELSEALADNTEDYTEDTKVDDMQQAFDEALFQSLRDWRARQATAAKIPAYIIAHDAMLKELATRRPQTKQALMAVKGMGANKLEKYGDDILRIIVSN